jgi:hypothetical protein
MNISRRLNLMTLAILSASLLIAPSPAPCQVSPAEITNPQLKALEEANLDKLMELNGEISARKFPLQFQLRRFVGHDSGNQHAADSRGLEFVKFHDHTVLKVSGNYNAAFNSDLLTQNERANRVLDDVVIPILPLLSKSFPPNLPFDAFGFEIAFHVRTHSKQFGYEGKEILAVVFDKADVPTFLNTERRSTRQEIIDRSQVYLDGKEFGLALGEKKAFDVEDLDKSESKHPAQAFVIPGHSESKPAEPAPATAQPNIAPASNPLVQAAVVREAPEAKPAEPPPASKDTDIRLAGLFPGSQRGFRLPNPVKPTTEAVASPPPATPDPANVPPTVDMDAVQKKYQPQLDLLTKDGLAHHHFVSYAPASLGLFHNQIYLQLTLRNPELFDKTSTSIYKRAAQSFDLFLAPQLKGLLAKISMDPEVAGVDVTVLDQFSHSASGSSEALEFICPLNPLRHFADADITNQDLIQQSIVLVNGVRVALNLQQVE